jgi:hypothetical protein
VSDEDFDKVRTESTRVINLVQFADEGAIDPMAMDRTATSARMAAWLRTRSRSCAKA